MIHDSVNAEHKSLPLISIIIPFFNTEAFLSPCLESVLNQSYQNFEVICIDDGSTDGSQEIVNRIMQSENRIHLISIENHGQGYARNLALKQARGEYVLFLDSDDTLDCHTLDLSVTQAELDQSDFVVFDWLFYYPNTGTTKYVNQDSFFRNRILEATECQELLSALHYFTVNKLYRRAFLMENKIVYGEGYIYEDNPFWVHAVLCSHKVSLIHSPLYRVTVHPSSSTKSNYNSDFHYKSFIKAINTSFDIIDEKEITQRGLNSLAYYFLKKYFHYFRVRTPFRFKSTFLHAFVDAFNRLSIEDQHKTRLLSFCLRHEVFMQKKYAFFGIVTAFGAYIKPGMAKMIRIIKNV